MFAFVSSKFFWIKQLLKFLLRHKCFVSFRHMPYFLFISSKAFPFNCNLLMLLSIVVCHAKPASTINIHKLQQQMACNSIRWLHTSIQVLHISNFTIAIIIQGALVVMSPANVWGPEITCNYSHATYNL